MTGQVTVEARWMFGSISSWIVRATDGSILAFFGLRSLAEEYADEIAGPDGWVER
jgi:hypothetical protein